MREVGHGARRGFHSLDLALGLVVDRFSWNVLTMSARLATKLSFAEARTTLASFIPDAPSTEVIEQTVLGLGRHTADWFAQAPAPEGDGEVMVILFDSKGVPTATESELQRSRGKRRRQRLPASPRHRGRHRRRRHGKKPRRNKGDKSKNARMATMVVMFTLERHGTKLLGPINRKLYASFAPKKHAFAIARREATKRGFGPGCGKLIQIVTDGDPDFATCAAEYFPDAMHTMDVIHVIEKLWIAGEALSREGTEPLRQWIDVQKDRRYDGKVDQIIAKLYQRRHAIGPTGPATRANASVCSASSTTSISASTRCPTQDHQAGSRTRKWRRGRCRQEHHGKRCDHGGMRWIEERFEAIVQLRCIEANGDWNHVIEFVHNRMRADAQRDSARLRLQSSQPADLPTLLEAA